MLEISLLGPLEVRIDGATVDVSGDVAKRLIAALATEAPVSPDRLVDILWADAPPASPRAALQTQVSRLRRRLGPDSIATTGAGYSFANAVVDVDRFERLSSSQDPDDLAAAVELLRGTPMAGIADCEGLEGARRALIELGRSARLRLADRWIDIRRADEAIPDLERLTVEDPLFEPAWASLATALHTAGRQPEAIQTIDRCRATLADAGLEPSPHLLGVEERIFGQPPGPPADSIRRSTVRARRTHMVGRSAAKAAIVELLASERVVTVVGPGGMGKTTLAEAVARDLEPAYFGGVVEVELSPETGDADVASAIARAFGVRWSDDPVEAVAAAIGTRPTLILLDNCEHVTGSAAQAVHQLSAAAGPVRILATSRERLGIPGEQTIQIERLGVRDCRRLFEARAAAIGATLVPEDEAAIERLCVALDGMPLAIEMAAARATAMTPAEMIELLEDDDAILEARGVADRHRTLDSLVEWSYQLLDPFDRRVFRGVSVFAGPFECRDAARVLDLPVVRAAAALGRLVDRSLLTARRRGPNTVFQMLATLRTAAQRRLEQVDELEGVRAAHASWAAEVTTSIADFPDRPDQRLLIERLRDALPDVLAAHRRALDDGDTQLQSSLLGPLFSYAYLSLPPGVAEAAEATFRSLRTISSPMDAWVCAVVAAYRVAGGRPDDADAALDRARTTVIGEQAWPVWMMTADVALYRGDLETAEAAARRAIRLETEGAASAGGWTDGRLVAAMAAAYGGRIAEGIDLAEEGLARARAHGGSAYLALAEYTVGEVTHDAEPERALAHLDHAIDLAVTHGVPFVEGIARVTQASTLARTGEHDEALTAFRDLIDLLERSGARIHLWTALRNVIMLLSDLGQHRDAMVLLGATEDRVSPTFGEEARRLEEVRRRAASALEDAAAAHREGTRLPIHSVPGTTRSIIDRITG